MSDMLRDYANQGTFDEGLAVGWAMCSNTGLNGGGGGGWGDIPDEPIWEPPSDWPECPDPGSNQITALIWVSKESAEAANENPGDFWEGALNYNCVSIDESGNNYNGPATINWGDGHVDTAPSGDSAFLNHQYSQSGFYIFTYTSDTRRYFYGNEAGDFPVVWLIVKYGSSMFLYDRFYANVSWIKFFNPNMPVIYPITNNESSPLYEYLSPFKPMAMASSPSLKRFESATPLNAIPSYFLSATRGGFRNFDFTGIKAIAGSAFYAFIRKIYAPNLEIMSGDAFNSFWSVMSIDMPNLIRIDGRFSLGGDTSAPLIKFSAPKLIEIFSDSFWNQTSLKYVDVSSISAIPIRAFGYCGSLIEFIAPFVENIDREGFRNCRSISEFKFDYLTRIEILAFTECWGIKEFYAPNCTYVGDNAFQNCYSLEKITLSENCTFGNNVFSGCNSLLVKPDGSPSDY